MEKEIKKLKMMKIGGIISAVIGVLSFLARVGTSSQMQGIEDSGVSLVIVGKETMRKKEYLEYASKMMTGYTIIAVAFIIVAVILLGLYYKKSNADSKN